MLTVISFQGFGTEVGDVGGVITPSPIGVPTSGPPRLTRIEECVGNLTQTVSNLPLYE